jgi:AcrR family transcriptional regulator
MPTSSTRSGRSGRRRGTTQTRDAIAAAARRQFAEVGYDRATMRSIATAAGVDPALIVHFYGSKEALFREVVALPPQMATAFVTIADGPREAVGRRLAETVVALLDNPDLRTVVLGRLRSAASHPEAAELVRDMVSRDLSILTGALTDDRPDLRAVLVGTQLVGLAFARHIVGVEPVASMSATALVDVLAPALQRLLVEPLTEAG